MNPLMEIMSAQSIENELCVAAVVARLAHQTQLWGEGIVFRGARPPYSHTN